MTVLDRATGQHLTEAEWLEARRSRIGASEAAAALGLSLYQSPLELWGVKTGRIEPPRENDAMWWGKRHEAPLLEKRCEDSGTTIAQTQVFCEHPTLPLVATLDAIDSEGCIVECKSIGDRSPMLADVSLAGDDDGVPQAWYIQAQQQMLCAGPQYKTVGFCVLIGGNRHVNIDVWRNDAVIDAMVPQLVEFMRLVEADEIPPYVNAKADVLKAIHAPREDEYEGGEREREAADLLQSLRALKAETTKQIELAESAIMSLTRGRQCRLADGRAIRYRDVSRKGYTVEPTTFRTLTIQKVRG
jgi:putative phage-type endonuclease